MKTMKYLLVALATGSLMAAWIARQSRYLFYVGWYSCKGKY